MFSNGICKFHQIEDIKSLFRVFRATVVLQWELRNNNYNVKLSTSYIFSDYVLYTVTRVHKIGTVSKGLESGLLECCQYTVYRSPITFPKVGFE